MDVVLPLVFAFAISKATQGTEAVPNEENLFVLIINDVILTGLYD